MSAVKKCPKCGEELEKGFLHLPRGAYWDTIEHKWHVPFLSGMCLISPWGAWYVEMPRVEGWRCHKCRLVIFGY